MKSRGGLLNCYAACFIGSVTLLVLGWLGSLPSPDAWPGAAHLALLPLLALELVGLRWLLTRAAAARTSTLLGVPLVMLALTLGLSAVVGLSLLGPLARDLALAAALLFAGLLGGAALVAGPLGAAVGFSAFAVIGSWCALVMSGVAGALPLLHWFLIYPLANALGRYPAWLWTRRAARQLDSRLAQDSPPPLAVVGRTLAADLALNLVSAALIVGLLIPLGELSAVGFGWLLGRPLDGPVGMARVVARALDEPLGAGLPISAMLLSTVGSTLWLGTRVLHHTWRRPAVAGSASATNP